MKRSRIRSESPKHRAFREELARNSVLVKSRDVCECCRCARGVLVHHRLRRTAGGGNDLDNLVWLCRACHDHIHAHPDWAYRQGWLLRRGQGVDKGYTTGGETTGGET